MPDRGYYTTQEVAKLLFVSPKTVSRWALQGRLIFSVTMGGHRRYRKEYIDDLANRFKSEGGFL